MDKLGEVQACCLYRRQGQPTACRSAGEVPAPQSAGACETACSCRLHGCTPAGCTPAAHYPAGGANSRQVCSRSPCAAVCLGLRNCMQLQGYMDGPREGAGLLPMPLAEAAHSLRVCGRTPCAAVRLGVRNCGKLQGCVDGRRESAGLLPMSLAAAAHNLRRRTPRTGVCRARRNCTRVSGRGSPQPAVLQATSLRRAALGHAELQEVARLHSRAPGGYGPAALQEKVRKAHARRFRAPGGYGPAVLQEKVRKAHAGRFRV
jgi:hypothetical protein